MLAVAGIKRITELQNTYIDSEKRFRPTDGTPRDENVLIKDACGTWEAAWVLENWEDLTNVSSRTVNRQSEAILDRDGVSATKQLFL